MTTHQGNLTPKHVASQQKQINQCPSKLREAQKIGQERLLEVATKKGHL